MENKNGAVFIRKAAVNLLGHNEENEKIIGESLLKDNITEAVALIRSKALFKIKTGNGFENALKIIDELSDCVSQKGNYTSEKEISKAINSWLKTKKKGEAAFFIRRYWSGERRAMLSAASFLSAEKLDKKLSALRKNLSEYFEKSGMEVADEEILFSAISGIDEGLAEKALSYKWRKAVYRFWQFWAAIGAVILMVIAAVCINIASEKNSEYNYYFRDCVINWSDSNYSFKGLEDSIPYDKSRNFGYMRKSIEKEGTIPLFKDYQAFVGTGYYSAEGELRRLSLTWEHIAYMGYGYRKIRISFVPGTPDEVPASMMLPLTEAGRAIPNVTTISTRDGITIYGVTDGRAVMVESANSEKRVRKLMFYKDGYWIEMDGLRMGAKDMGVFLEWLFEDEIELGRFEYAE